MSHFTLREPETIERKDDAGNTIKKVTLFFRELGYVEWDELKLKFAARAAELNLSKSRAGMLMMQETVLACVEMEDGSPAYTEESWRRESKSVIQQIGKRALKAQGLDLDAIADQEPLTEDESEGNDEPSRKSGTNSLDSSAAAEPSQS